MPPPFSLEVVENHGIVSNALIVCRSWDGATTTLLVLGDGKNVGRERMVDKVVDRINVSDEVEWNWTETILIRMVQGLVTCDISFQLLGRYLGLIEEQVVVVGSLEGVWDPIYYFLT